jgi:hypothetical protein
MEYKTEYYEIKKKFLFQQAVELGTVKEDEQDMKQ